MNDLSKIPPPDILEQLSFEQIRDELVSIFQFITRDIPSTPVMQLLEAIAYRELYLRARINDAVKAVLLPTSWGTNLDNIGARDGVERLVLDPGDPTATPPIPPTLEDPDDYRQRILEATRAVGAGVTEAYESAARAAHPAIRDVLALRTGPAEAMIRVLAPGASSEEIEPAVLEAGGAVRMLTDEVPANT
ncbi:MAG: hypothetical protein MO852_16365, partial [Candidatus Devosia euplotis]|nr:hypothetical protein [Candidatus Devosia euplotis]